MEHNYTDPEIACAGLTADEAKAAGIDTATGKYIMSGWNQSMVKLRKFLDIPRELRGQRASRATHGTSLFRGAKRLTSSVYRQES